MDEDLYLEAYRESSMEDEDRDIEDMDEDEAWFETVRTDEDWADTRKLAISGEYFGHRKHKADVDVGVQHKLMVWHCEARKPAQRCWCGLYSIAWVD